MCHRSILGNVRKVNWEETGDLISNLWLCVPSHAVQEKQVKVTIGITFGFKTVVSITNWL